MKESECRSCPVFKECTEKFGERSHPPCCDEMQERVRTREVELAAQESSERMKLQASLVADNDRTKVAVILTVTGIFFLLLLIASCMIGCPSYNVYSQKMQGRAILAHAQSSREVAVAEAKAKMESAVLLAAADTLRAQGVARSNIIIGQSLTDSYLRWFWISELKPGGQVIYVPTEANLPILEAAKRKDN